MAIRPEKPPIIRLMLADDHALLREGLKALLTLEPDFKVVAEAARADELKLALIKTRCDVLVLDLKMDRSVINDIDVLSRRAKVVVLTGSERVEDALTSLRLGARGIVQKKFAVKNLVEAIRAVAAGLVWMPPSLQAKLTAQWGGVPNEQLTAREQEIVRNVAGGLKNAEIAEKLGISEMTVKTHLNNVFQKLAVRDRVGLTLYALRVGLSALPDDQSE
jgi:DNA-binding NarL/FixJ family response regulator